MVTFLFDLLTVFNMENFYITKLNSLREVSIIKKMISSGLITLVRQVYKIYKQFSENCYSLVNRDSKRKAFVQVYHSFWSYYLLSYNPNILETLNLAHTLFLIYPFLAWPWFDANWSVTPLLATAGGPQSGGCVNHTFQDLLLYQWYNL